MSSFNKMFEYMGVVNATPNSFSDGGEALDPETLKGRLLSWQNIGARYIDLGAESTAPMNDPIGHEQEWQRISSVISNFKNQNLSLDSFRPETVKKFLEFYPLALWNDVSGTLDSSLEDILKKHPTLQTVYCHNRAPTRELAPKHMSYVSDEDILVQLEQAFSTALLWYKERGFKAPFLDFCFGFSKTFEQNWTILKALPSFIADFENKHGAQQWVLAVSRKSFFKRIALEGLDQDVRGQTEYMQSFYLAWLWQNLAPDTKMLVRLHDPAVAHAVINVGAML